MDKLTEVATRIYNLVDPWEREQTPEEIAEDIKNDPTGAISYLLDLIDELTA